MGEVGKAANDLIEALKSRPEFIVLIVLNIVFAYLGYSFLQHEFERDDASRLRLLERCLPTHAGLSAPSLERPNE